MGQSGIFLKEKQELVLEKLVESVKLALDKTGYLYLCEYESGWAANDKYEYYCMSVREDKGSEKGFLMYLYGKSKDVYDLEFDWIREGACLNQAVNIEDFYGCEDMLLRFAHEYLKIFPEDIFWDEMDWYYTKADIDYIVCGQYDENWCYMNPLGLARHCGIVDRAE